MRMVLDTNVVVSALLWTGAPNLLFREPGLQFVVSYPMLAELSEVLERRKFKKVMASRGLDARDLLAAYAVRADLVTAVDVGRVAPDADDDVVLGTAIAGRVGLLVTGDRALLTVKEFGGVVVCDVASALWRIGVWVP